MKMNKRIIAFAAAVVMTSGIFTACGKKTEDDAQAETSVNIIENGTEAVIEGDVTTNDPNFNDPAAQLGIGSDVSDVPDVPEGDAAAYSPIQSR